MEAFLKKRLPEKSYALSLFIIVTQLIYVTTYYIICTYVHRYAYIPAFTMRMHTYANARFIRSLEYIRRVGERRSVETQAAFHRRILIRKVCLSFALQFNSLNLAGYILPRFPIIFDNFDRTSSAYSAFSFSLKA